ncbi:hypothetical protein pb186bvf_003938 [Paramecium bursaria]
MEDINPLISLFQFEYIKLFNSFKLTVSTLYKYKCLNFKNNLQKPNR